MARWDKHYRMDNAGFQDLANSSEVSDIAVEAAERGRRFAQADDPDGEYGVDRRTVIAGRPGHEAPRAGAVLESRKASAGARKRTLLRSVNVIENP